MGWSAESKEDYGVQSADYGVLDIECRVTIDPTIDPIINPTLDSALDPIIDPTLDSPL
jgi:hypothetical protein